MRASTDKLALVLCAVLGASACDDGSAAAAADQKVLEAAAEKWAALRSCLVGPPLAEGEQAKSRMLQSELTLVAQGLQTPWPSSCAPLGTALGETLETLKSDASVSQYAQLAKVAKELGDTRPTMMLATESPVVGRLFEAAAAAGMLKSPAAPAPAAASATAATSAPSPSAEPADAGAVGESQPPPASRPLPTDQLAALGESKGFIERVEAAPSETVRFVLGDTDAGAFYCALGSSEAPLDHARCWSVTGEVNVAATPLSAESADAHYVFNIAPEPVVQQIGGESYDLPVGKTAFVFDNGTIGDVVPSRPKPELVRRLAQGKVEKAPLTPPGGGTMLAFRGGALTWRGPVRGASGRRPFVTQKVQDGRIGLSGRVEVGELPRNAANVASCRSGEHLHLFVADADPAGKDMVESKRNVAVATRTGDKWSKPVASTVDVGVGALDWWDTGVRSFTCQGDVATFTWMRADRRVGQLRCQGEVCEVAMSEPLAEAGTNEKIRVSNLGDRTLVIRTLRGMGPISGLTELVAMRLAPIGELARAKDRVLLGDDKHGGLPDLHKSLGLISVGAAAVVLVHSGPNIYGLRLDGDGNPTKLRLEKGGT